MEVIKKKKKLGITESSEGMRCLSMNQEMIVNLKFVFIKYLALDPLNLRTQGLASLHVDLIY